MPELTSIKKVTQLSWRRHLLSEAGIEGQLVLREGCPLIPGGGEAHNIIFAAGRAEGWRLCIEAMHNLIAVEKQVSESLENP